MHQTHDINNRPYAKLSTLSIGDTVELDSGFTCCAGKRVLFANEKQDLYFECTEGRHFLFGQADDGEHCVGIYGPL